LKVELARNSNATRTIDGEPTLSQVAELDLVELTQDKAAGRIKSVTEGKFGTSVELYPADAALRDLTKHHGLFEKDNTQRSITITIDRDDDQL
jgi:hypothetical protein